MYLGQLCRDLHLPDGGFHVLVDAATVAHIAARCSTRGLDDHASGTDNGSSTVGRGAGDRASSIVTPSPVVVEEIVRAVGQCLALGVPQFVYVGQVYNSQCYPFLRFAAVSGMYRCVILFVVALRS